MATEEFFTEIKKNNANCIAIALQHTFNIF